MSDQNTDFDKDLMDQFAANQNPKDDEQKTDEPKQDEKVNLSDDKDVPTNTEEPKKPEDIDQKPEDKPTDIPGQDDKGDEVKFDMEAFNKVLERDEPFESIDQVKELLNLKPLELKAQLEEKDKILAENEEAIKEGFNPMSYFANEQQFKINQILKANEGLNENIVNRVVTSDLNELNDEDVLLLNELIETKGTYDERIVKLAIKDRYGLNVNKEDLENDELQAFQVKEYNLKKDAEKARGNLDKMTNIDLPAFKDPKDLAEERKAERDKVYNDSKDNWKQFADEYTEKLDKLTISYRDDENKEANVDFNVDSKFKDILKEKLPEYAAMLGKDVNDKKDVASVVEQVQKDYLWLRRGDLVKSIVNDIETKKNQETVDKYENPSKPKQTEAPVQLSDEDRHNQAQKDKMLKDFGLKK